MRWAAYSRNLVRMVPSMSLSAKVEVGEMHDCRKGRMRLLNMKMGRDIWLG
jgi:hypothetical protein